MLTPFGRKIKQINILLGWLIFLLLISAFTWFLVMKPQAIGKIESLEIKNLQTILKEKDELWQPPFTYRLTADILNPNETFNAKRVDYVFEVQDKDKKVITKKEGTTEIHAEEQKTIREEIVIEALGKNVSFQLTKAQWEQITSNE